MQTFEGIVTSSKGINTVGVEVVFFQKHPKYQKVLKKTTRVLAHNEISSVRAGDLVEVVKTRPYSKLKHFKVTRKI